MKLLKDLLVVIAATGAMGSAQAQIPGNTFDLGTLTPAGTVTTDTFASGSFLDTFIFTISTTNTMFTGATESSNVTNLQFQLLDSGNTLLFSGLNLSADLTPGSYHALISGDVASPGTSGTFSFSTAANPEPAEWMMLLAGLVVVGFMARRKTSLMAG
jgi:hypothetical protein